MAEVNGLSSQTRCGVSTDDIGRHGGEEEHGGSRPGSLNRCLFISRSSQKEA